LTSVARPLPFLDPLAALAVFAAEPFALLFDSAALDQRGRFSYLCVRPRRVIEAQAFDGTDAFAQVAEALGPPRPSLPGLPPFQGGAAGLFAYDLAHQVERLPRHQPEETGWPALAVGLFDAVVAWDHQQGLAWVLGTAEAADALVEALAGVTPLAPPDWSVTGRFAADLTAEAYGARVARVIDYIHAGDIFQANLSQRFRATLPVGLSPLTLYRRLRALAPGPFSAYFGLGDAALLSVSPERFLAVDAEGRVEARPIKGTRRRGSTPEEDQALADELLASVKDRAENLMIVDLLRNDLSRSCQMGSIRVPQLCSLEHFAAVHHLVSAVEGVLAPGLGPLDLLRAAFPGGSITGAPKVRAMEIIAELEDARRGPFFGSIAWMGYNRAMDSSILIRTMSVAGDTVLAQAGGGIVADSDPVAEVAETMVKAAALLASLEGRG